MTADYEVKAAREWLLLVARSFSKLFLVVFAHMRITSCQHLNAILGYFDGSPSSGITFPISLSFLHIIRRETPQWPSYTDPHVYGSLNHRG